MACGKVVSIMLQQHNKCALAGSWQMKRQINTSLSLPLSLFWSLAFHVAATLFGWQLPPAFKWSKTQCRCPLLLAFAVYIKSHVANLRIGLQISIRRRLLWPDLAACCGTQRDSNCGAADLWQVEATGGGDRHAPSRPAARRGSWDADKSNGRLIGRQLQAAKRKRDRGRDREIQLNVVVQLMPQFISGKDRAAIIKKRKKI